MRLNCMFSLDISESIRGQIISGRLYAKESAEAARCDIGAIAKLELGYVDIELNLEASGWHEYGDECAPSLRYFICVDTGETWGIMGFDVDSWVSYDYADSRLPDEDAHANIDWAAENWEELLFQDMLDSLLKFVRLDGLHVLSPNRA